jgi:CarD family transcriptional regulator
MAVYPSQGVGVIEAINVQDVMGQPHEVYVLRIVDSDMRIMVPVGNAQNVGLRSLIDKSLVGNVYTILQEPSKGGKVASWSRRQRLYQEKIRTNDLMEVAEVLRDLCHIRSDKELSYGEKKVLEQTQRLLVKELALAAGSEERQVVEQLSGIFH